MVTFYVFDLSVIYVCWLLGMSSKQTSKEGFTEEENLSLTNLDSLKVYNTAAAYMHCGCILTRNLIIIFPLFFYPYFNFPPNTSKGVANGSYYCKIG